MEPFSVLIADDVRSSRFMLHRLLQQIGIDRILEAEDGKTALSQISEHQPDLVLLDIRMPHMDGIQVLRQMKKDPLLRHIPAIMITVVEDLETAVHCIENGAEDFLPKPYNPVLLRARVTACLEKKRLLDMERAYLRNYDADTGLPNRHFFTHRLSMELDRYRRRSQLFAVFIIRLTRHQTIADSLGPLAADTYVRQQGRRLVSHIGEKVLAARLSANELGVLMVDLTSMTHGHGQARDIAWLLHEPLLIDGHQVGGGVAVGIVYGSDEVRHPDKLIRDAGLAAKRIGAQTGFLLFDERMHAEAMRQLALGNDLQQAVSHKQLQLAYQPIVSLASGRVSGFEALVRWQHPQRGVILPDQFISLAEENGLIIPIGSWVLQEAIQQMGRWRTLGLGGTELTLNVNVSARQLLDEAFLGSLERILDRNGYVGYGLRLELTETALIDNPDRVAQILADVRGLQLETALDDFGTGYCSLSYLHRYPFDMLKIDRSFVREIDSKSKNREIVQSTIDLAHRLKMTVVAEGVETQSEAQVLAQLGCEYAQGFKFHAPLALEAASLLLQANG